MLVGCILGIDTLVYRVRTGAQGVQILTDVWGRYK